MEKTLYSDYTRELDREFCTGLSILYTQTDDPCYYCDWPTLNDHVSILRSIYVIYII